MPTRSGVHGACRPGPQSPTVRVAAASHAASRASETRHADGAEVGQRLHDVAVGVAHVEGVGAIARADRRVAAGAHPESLVRLGDLQRLVPVAGAHAGDRGQAIGRVGDVAVGVRVGEVAPAVGERPAQSARGERERTDEGDRHEREEDEDEDPGLPARLERGRALGAGEADGQPGGEQDEDHRDQGDAELVAGRRALGQRHVVGAQRVRGEGPEADQAAAEGARGQDGHAAQAQRHDGEPHRAPHAQRQQRAARVGEQEGHGEQSERRIGERADGRMARAPGAQPQARRPRGGGHEAHGVPVAERLAQAGVDLVGVQRAGEDLGQQRVAAHHHAGEDDAPEQRGPAVREEPHQGHAGHHGGQVAERAVGLDPRAGGLDRPGDRRGGDGHEQAHEGERERPPQSAGVAADEDRRRGQAAGDDVDRQLDLGHRPELKPASALEGDGGQHRAEGDGRQRLGRDPRQREAPREGAGVSRSGVRGHDSRATSRRRQGRWRRAGI